jgi:signal transduction histidine kinase
MNYRKDGSAFLNQVELAPIRDASGCVRAFLGLQKDVTDEARREEADRQRQRIEALGRMVGGIAHEINNLLQPVTLLTEEMRRRHGGGGDICIDTILDCTLKARQIIGDLLAFCRPTSHGTEMVSVRCLLEDALVLVRKAVGPGTSMILLAGNEEPVMIRVNRTAFTQILLNLASNAAAAMDGDGTITVRLEVLPPAAAGTRRDVEISVEDSGSGMDAVTLERAFEPFFTTKPLGQGTGLGLSVVFGLVADMGGHITLESTRGRGTTAIVRVPQAQGEQ